MAGKHQVIIDTEKCTGCGLCKKDCVGFDIAVVDGKAVANGKSCIACGHCEAICPQHLPIIKLLKDVADHFEE